MNFKDENRKLSFPTKPISLVTKLALLAKNTFCCVQNIIICTPLEFLEVLRVFLLFMMGVGEQKALITHQWAGSEDF